MKGRDKIYRLKSGAVQAMGGKCSICGYDKYMGALDIHHVNHDGGKDREKSNIPYRMYRDIVNGTRDMSDLRLLCANCHREIHHIEGESILRPS
jgi:5-methylcytosine-specific restriction endonuclease McrA